MNTVPADQRRVLDHADFGLADLGERWSAARRAALIPRLGPKAEGAHVERFDHALESRLLDDIPEALRDDVLRAVFDNSWKLGRSLARRLSLVFDPSDFADLLTGLALPCQTGSWRVGGAALVLRRSLCATGPARPFHCRYWREAVDGFVMGAGDKARYVRHGSRGHGDAECVDLLYEENAYQRPDAPKWAPLTDEMTRMLAPVVSYMTVLNIDLQFVGFGEQTLYYRMSLRSGSLCGGTLTMCQALLRGRVASLLPRATLQDVAPRAVSLDQAGLETAPPGAPAHER